MSDLDENTKCLTQEEYLGLKLFMSRAEQLSTVRDLKQAQVNLARMQASLLKAQLREQESQISRTYQNLQDAEEKLTKHKQSKDELLEPIRERLDLEGEFGFDEETLEVKQEPQE